MNTSELITYYETQGLEVEHVIDPPGKVYDSEGHERTILYTLAGSVKLYREGRGEQLLLPGVQAIVETGQLHSAVVGQEGWEFIAAFDPAEAAKLNS